MTSRPANNSFKCAWMIDDSRTKVFVVATSGDNWITRGSTRGALTMAIEVSRPNASRPDSSTMKLRLLLTTWGKGWAGSSPIGVNSGFTSRLKYSVTHCRCASLRSTLRKSRIPAAASAGRTCPLSVRYFSATSVCASSLMRLKIVVS